MDHPDGLHHAPATTMTRPPKVLVVDDSEMTRSIITRALVAHGHEVSEACDGHEALKTIASTPFDAILLDLIMPNLDGWQFRQTQLRFPALARIPTIVVTSRALGEYERDALRTPYVVVKPFAERGLLSVLNRAMGLGERSAVSAEMPSAAVPDRLFWSKRGEVACATHAPDGTSARWLDERWAAIPVQTGMSKVVFQCQHCPGAAGPVRRRRQG